MENFWLILIGVISYLLGSIPCSYLLGKRYGKNLFKEGSGNTGVMNVWRSTKKVGPSILALIGDAGKAALAIAFCYSISFLGYNLSVALGIVAFFVVLGHNYSLFLNSKGGRGIACLIGILFVLNFKLFFACFGVVLFVIFFVEFLLKGKTSFEWGGFKQLFHIFGSQILGRVVGIILSLVLVYFLDIRIFWIILPAIVLVIIKHIKRTKGYIENLGKRR